VGARGSTRLGFELAEYGILKVPTLGMKEQASIHVMEHERQTQTISSEKKKKQ